MITELSIITVKEGRGDDLEKLMTGPGLAAMRSAPGMIDVKLHRGVENPDRFAIVAIWESIEQHTAVYENADIMKVFKPFADMQDKTEWNI